MCESNSIETHNIYPNLNDQKRFRLNEFNEIKDYFVADIKERDLMRKGLAYILLLLTILINLGSISKFINDSLKSKI